MIWRLSTPLTHAAPLNAKNVFFPRIVHHENISYRGFPSKNTGIGGILVARSYKEMGLLTHALYKLTCTDLHFHMPMKCRSIKRDHQSKSLNCYPPEKKKKKKRRQCLCTIFKSPSKDTSHESSFPIYAT